MPLHVQLVDEIALYIATRQYSQPVDVYRTNLSTEQYQNVTDTSYNVRVFPGSRSTGDRQNRYLWNRVYQAFVVVFGKITGDDFNARKAREDTVINLGEEIEDSLLNATMISGLDIHRWEETDYTAPSLVPELARAQNVFGTVFSVQYFHQIRPGETTELQTRGLFADVDGAVFLDADGKVFADNLQ